MTEQALAIRALKITVVKNGLIAYPRDDRYGPGEEAESYVFATVEQLTDWLLKQVWSYPGGDHG